MAGENATSNNKDSSYSKTIMPLLLSRRGPPLEISTGLGVGQLSLPGAETQLPQTAGSLITTRLCLTVRARISSRLRKLT